jgi:hypothetical protein
MNYRMRVPETDVPAALDVDPAGGAALATEPPRTGVTATEPSGPAEPSAPIGPASSSGPSASSGAGSVPRRFAAAARFAAPAVALYAALRLTGLGVLWWYARHGHADLLRKLDGRHDATWYAGIVDHGYATSLVTGPDGHLLTTNIAFFPLYPAMMWLVQSVTGAETHIAGLIVAWIASLVAAWGIFAVGAHVHSRRAGIFLVALWAVLPHAIVQSMAYSETLFTALAAWTLYAVLKRHWLTAGVLALFAGLTRPTANAVILVVCVAALIAVVRRRDGWRPWVAMVVAPLGYLGFLLWVGHRLGRLDGFLYADREAWHVRLDGGRETVAKLGHFLVGSQELGVYGVIAVLGLTLTLFVLSVLDRQPWQLLLFSATAIVFVLGAAGGFLSKGRYMMPIFPILLPAAIAMARARTRMAVTVLVALAGMSAWYGSYLLMSWPWSP